MLPPGLTRPTVELIVTVGKAAERTDRKTPAETAARGIPAGCRIAVGQRIVNRALLAHWPALLPLILLIPHGVLSRVGVGVLPLSHGVAGHVVAHPLAGLHCS